MELGRGWWMRKRGILWTFVTIDVLTTIMQVTGAALIGSAESNQEDPKPANNVLLAGLAVQTAAFAIFLVLLTIVILSILRHGTRRAKSPFLAVLGIASVLVFLRTIFRLVETAQGVFGYLSTHGGYFAGLEFTPVVVAVWLLAIWFPGRWPIKEGSGAPRDHGNVLGRKV